MRLYKGDLVNESRYFTGKRVFVNAVNEKDAERIINNNLDTRFYNVTDIKEADIIEMDEKSIPIGFRHPLA